MLRRLDGATLYLLGEHAAGAKLTGRRQLDVDLADGQVLNVLLEIELHQRVPAAGAKPVLGGNDHGVLGCLFALLLLLRRLRHRPAATERAGGGSGDGCGDRKSTRLNSSNDCGSRMQSSA